MGLRMRNFSILDVHWKIWLSGRRDWGLGQFVDLRGKLGKKEGVGVGVLGGGEGGGFDSLMHIMRADVLGSIHQNNVHKTVVIRLIVLPIEHWQSTHQLMTNLLKAHSHVDWPVNLNSFYAKFKIRFWVKTAENSCKCLDRKVRSKCNSLLVWMESISSCICS